MEREKELSHLNFKSLLMAEFTERRNKNPQYSLRAFARSLSIDPSTLSKYFKGKRGLGISTLRSVAKTLDISSAKLEKVLHNENLSKKEAELYLIDQEYFEVLKDWKTWVILEAMDLEDFEFTPNWFAEKLQVHPLEVIKSLDNLKKAGVISFDENGEACKKWEMFTTQKNESVDNSHLRHLQSTILDQAKESIFNNPPESKSHTAYITSVDSELMDELKDEIKKFRRRIAKLIEEKSKKRDKVICLHVSLFPQTKEKKDV